MKFTRKQFLAALAGLSTLPGRLLALKTNSSPPQPAPPGAPLRLGPWLADWRQVQWVPVFESVHPTAQRLVLAALWHEILMFRYWGGRTPGAERSVSPGLVFQAGGYGPLYVSGYCHLRRQERVFRVDRVELLAEADGIICKPRRL
jgi:predicted DNA-binding transcriptional regulator YafY